ncbi:MAG: hypothetical protein K0Q87_4279, partial [Neobacillus sp.]|nr:hypothetical protein [Neobacillus sp.]
MQLTFHLSDKLNIVYESSRIYIRFAAQYFVNRIVELDSRMESLYNASTYLHWEEN